jgi:hypothetical protein
MCCQQVDKEMFDETQSDESFSTLKQYFIGIKQTFDIDWTVVSWSDLKKPLYSALGARLYIQLRLQSSLVIPRAVNEQAVFWMTYYNSAGRTVDFIGAVTNLNQGLLRL